MGGAEEGSIVAKAKAGSGVHVAASFVLGALRGAFL